MSRIVRVAAARPDDPAIAAAAEAIRRGELVALPTETVYGLGANAMSAAAVERIYAAKGRPATNPLIVHVDSPAMARTVVAEWPELAERLAAAFWPGPLTLVLPRRPEVPRVTAGGLDSVGVRVPAHPIARALIRAAGVPIAAPSANPYMGVSPTTAAHVAAGLGERPVLILDGGPSQVGLESTVLDLTRPVPTVLRPGGLPVARLREVLGRVDLLEASAGAHLPSPGLAERHYAPRARVELLEPDALWPAVRSASGRVGVMAFSAPEAAPGRIALMPDDPEAYGARLYAELHAFDAAGIEHLFIEQPPDSEAWLAVRDRLRRAAS